MKSWIYFPGPNINFLCQVFSSCPLFQYIKVRRASQFLPPLVELATHAVSKKHGDIGAGIIITLPTHPGKSSYVVTIAGLIEGHAHIFGKGNATFPLDTFNNQLL